MPTTPHHTHSQCHICPNSVCCSLVIRPLHFAYDDIPLLDHLSSELRPAYRLLSLPRPLHLMLPRYQLPPMRKWTASLHAATSTYSQNGIDAKHPPFTNIPLPHLLLPTSDALLCITNRLPSAPSTPAHVSLLFAHPRHRARLHDNKNKKYPTPNNTAFKYPH